MGGEVVVVATSCWLVESFQPAARRRRCLGRRGAICGCSDNCALAAGAGQKCHLVADVFDYLEIFPSRGAVWRSCLGERAVEKLRSDDVLVFSDLVSLVHNQSDRSV